jgi:hypothetical protein
MIIPEDTSIYVTHTNRLAMIMVLKSIITPKTLSNLKKVTYSVPKLKFHTDLTFEKFREMIDTENYDNLTIENFTTFHAIIGYQRNTVAFMDVSKKDFQNLEFEITTLKSFETRYITYPRVLPLLVKSLELYTKAQEKSYI